MDEAEKTAFQVTGAMPGSDYILYIGPIQNNVV